jgi:hypothetical protein
VGSRIGRPCEIAFVWAMIDPDPREIRRLWVVQGVRVIEVRQRNTVATLPNKRIIVLAFPDHYQF